jgi:RNA polymerase sigma-70 factor (ECF subfamily)
VAGLNERDFPVMDQIMAQASLDMAACLERVRQRDEEAARALVRELFPLVMKIVRSHLPRRTDEEDLAQMVFGKVFAHLDQYLGAVPFEHWVSRVAVNTCLNQMRSEKCRPELRWADLSEEEAEVVSKMACTAREPDPSEQITARDLARKMLEALEPKDRLILKLLDLEERSVEEVRELTGWNASRIKVRAFRARRKLRKQFGKMMEEEKR